MRHETAYYSSWTSDSGQEGWTMAVSICHDGDPPPRGELERGLRASDGGENEF